MRTLCKIKIVLLFSLCHWLSVVAYSQGTWIQKGNFPGPARGYGIAFVIGSKAYVGLGYDGAFPFQNGCYKDLWEYDPIADSWTRKADLPAVPRVYSIAFSINNIGYVALGEDSTANYLREVWAYNPTNNTWTRKANFPGNGRYATDCFVIGNKAYTGFGWDSTGWRRDFWKYDPSIDQWTQLPNAPFTGRQAPSLFSISGKGYLSCGWDSTGSTLQDLWQFDTVSYGWTQKNNFPGITRYTASRFVAGNLAYLGNGFNSGGTLLNDFRSYNPSFNSWTSVTQFPGPIRVVTSDFSINGKGYVCLGFNSANITPFKDVWQYTPSPAGISTLSGTEDFHAIYDFVNTTISVDINKPTEFELCIINMQGQCILKEKHYDTFEKHLSDFPSGTYILRFITKENVLNKKIIIP